MAKRTRATARRRPTTLRRSSRKPPAVDPLPKPASRNRIVYTPELIAHARHLYENTGVSLAKIAVDLGVHRSTLSRIGERERWQRYVLPPRDVPPAMRLLADAEALEAEALLNDSGAAESVQAPPSNPSDDERGPPPTGRDMVERLYRAVVDELAAVEAMRAQLGRHPRGSVEAERTARTLWSLTETFQKLQRLQCAAPDKGSGYDMPADIDEFRNELARRIDEMVASRSDEGIGERPDAPDPNDPARH
jgi:hypothetical protein